MVTIPEIVKDLRRLVHSIDSRWNKNQVTAGIHGDAMIGVLKVLDLEALRRCIEWMIDEPPAGGVSGYKAALRLQDQIPTIKANRIAILNLLK